MKPYDDLLCPRKLAVAKAADAALAPKLRDLNLPKFETHVQCLHRQARMMELFNDYPPPTVEWDGLWHCGPKTCAMEVCTEACHLATMRRRLVALDSGLPILAAQPGLKCSVSLVHPQWEARVGLLEGISMGAAAQWNYRRLKELKNPALIAIGIFEVSLNRNLDGEVYWAGGIHQIVAGASEGELRRAFKISGVHRQRRPGQRMVVVEPVEKLATEFAYAQKRFVEQKIAYISGKNGRQDRFPLPLRPENQAEHDAWLLSLPLGARTVLYGCSRKGVTVFPTVTGTARS